MGKDSYEAAIEGLKKLLREKGDLQGVAATKIKQITTELEAAGSKACSSDDRLKNGFYHFKKEKYEYAL